MDDFLIQVFNGDRLVHEYELDGVTRYEAEQVWRDECRLGGSVYLLVKEPSGEWLCIRKMTRRDDY